MKVSVEDLLERPYLGRSMSDRLKIVEAGKPRPILNMAAVVTADGDGELITYQFREAMYDEIQWLTGCDKRNAFFCWPCLLFMPPSGPWNTIGVEDFVCYLGSKPEHENSFEHLQSVMKLTSMIEHNVKESYVDVSQHNDMVKRNRAIFKRMIDVLCNVVALERPSAERMNGCQLDPEHLVKNLKFLHKYDVLNCNYIEDAIDILEISPTIVNDMVDTVEKQIKMAIKKEIRSSTYVSIILSDHSKISEKSQMSTILRYIKGGSKVCERFVGFLNTVGGRSVSIVFDHISSIVNEYGFAEKFLALAIDGSVLKTADLIKLTSLVKEKYRYTFFVPYYCHGLDNVLQQSLSSIKECSAFFKAMNEMKSFLGKKTKRYKALESFMSAIKSNQNMKVNKWFNKSQFIQSVNSFRSEYVSFFESVLKNSIMWDPEDITKALGFKHILEDFDTVFFLETFAMLSESVGSVSKVLKSDSPENVLSGVEVSVLEQKLTELADKFEHLWNTVNDPDKRRVILGPDRKKIKPDPDDPKFHRYRNIYKSIIDCLSREINARFTHLTDLRFCQIFIMPKNMGVFVFTNEMLQLFSSCHAAKFDEEQIKNEVIVMRTNGTLFAKKTAYDVLDFFVKTRLRNAFKYLYKLAEFVLTLPLKPPTADGDLNKLKDIDEWSYSPETPEAQPGDVSVAAIELNFLQDLKKMGFFHDEVAALFYEINHTFELMYK